MNQSLCKVCGSATLKSREHTAKCRDCGLLMYHPYPTPEELTENAHEISTNPDWYRESANRNHDNFTRMFRFAASDLEFDAKANVLDYGGGGGQFATVVRSHAPLANVFLTDIDDESGLPGWDELTTRIPFSSFESDTTNFDLIFLNDVFEHVIDPNNLLKILATKLKPKGLIFIDTPRQFWLYPATKLLAPSIHNKVLRGTVTKMHLQIWTDKALRQSVETAGLVAHKWEHWGEYTREPTFYLRNMGISNPLLIRMGKFLFGMGGIMARNKLAVVLKAK